MRTRRLRSSTHHVSNIETRALRSSHFVAMALRSQNSYYIKTEIMIYRINDLRFS